MTSWSAAPAVAALLREADERWPARNRASDGTIGDAAHAASVSDHNPDDRGVVHAVDLTHDPAHGVDCGRLAAAIVARRDHRVRYLIFDRRIVLGPWSDSVRAGTAPAWRWRPYTGPDPHVSHLHVSIGYAAAVESDTSPWFAGGGVADPADPKGWDEMATEAEIRKVVADAVEAKLRATFGKAVGPGQRDVAGTIAATLGNVQALHNRVGALAAQLGALAGAIAQLAEHGDRVVDAAALTTAATEGAAAALHQLGEKLVES